MANPRQRLEIGFELWGAFVTRYPWGVILVVLALVAGMVSQVRHVQLAMSPEELLEPDHPARAAHEAYKREFGLDQVLLIGLRPEDPFAPEFLAWLRDLHRELEDEVPYVADTNSLINARVTRGEGDSLIVDDLFENWPQNPEEYKRIREYARANTLYENFVLHKKSGLTFIVMEFGSSGQTENALEGFGEDAFLGQEEVPLLTAAQRGEAVRIVLDILDQRAPPELEVHTVGIPVVEEQGVVVLQANMARFTQAALLSILLLLALIFRRPSGVFLPPLLAIIGLACTAGAAGFRGVPLNLTVQALPSLLLAVSVASSVHLLVVFYQRLDAREARRDAVIQALGHSALPIVFAGLTTAGGMASFASAEMQSVRDIGVLGPAGIVIALLLGLTLLPALLAVLPIKAKRFKEGDAKESSAIGRLVVGAGDLACARPVAVLTVSLLTAACVMLGITQLQFKHDPLRWLPYWNPARQSMEQLSSETGAVATLELLIDTGVENGLHEPKFLSEMEQLHRRIPELERGIDEVIVAGKVLSFVDILRETHRALNENNPDFYTVPAERNLVAQELLLFENSGVDDLEEFVDSSFSKARLSLRMPWADVAEYSDYLPAIEALVRETLAEDVDIELTGFLPVTHASVGVLRSTMIRSYVIALIIITPLMMLLIGSFRGGLVSMLPNLVPLGMALGFMGWIGLELSILSVLAGGLAIGLAVDDTIHVFHQYYRYRGETGDHREAIRRTMSTTGRALFTTTAVLAIAFMVYSLSFMRPLISLSVATTSAILLAFLADIFMAPALLTLLYRRD